LQSLTNSSQWQSSHCLDHHSIQNATVKDL
jgi:hypothetical protein